MDDDDHVLDLDINYSLFGCYGEELTKERKRAVQKRAARLVVKRDVFLQKKERKVTGKKEQKASLSYARDLFKGNDKM